MVPQTFPDPEGSLLNQNEFISDLMVDVTKGNQQDEGHNVDKLYATSQVTWKCPIPEDIFFAAKFIFMTVDAGSRFY